MASKLLQIPIQTFKPSNPSCNFKKTTIISLSFSINTVHQQQQHSLESLFSFSRAIEKPQILKPRTSLLLLPKCTASSPKPPSTKEEAILQAKTSLLSTLEKPLNNPKLPRKIKKLKQPRLRVEIPVTDDSPSSLSELAIEVFGEMPVTRKGSQVKVLLLWPSRSLTEAAVKAFGSSAFDVVVQNIDVSSVLDEDIRVVDSADVAVFMAPEASLLAAMKTVTDRLSPRPAVIFNPRWGFEEEADFGGMSGFVGTFEVVYSFTGLEVRGILSKRKGVIFKFVRDGVLSGEKWNVLVEEEEGELRVVSRFKARPSITEVENVLYNLMAINSPVTKYAKFLKDLVSNVTGKK